MGVQELKELTRMRLAREAVGGFSPEVSEVSERRSGRLSGGSGSGDLESYSDSIHRSARSGSSSPISNADSDSVDDVFSRQYPYNLPRQQPQSQDEAHVPLYGKGSASSSGGGGGAAPLPLPPAPGFNAPVSSKYVTGIHPGLHAQLLRLEQEQQQGRQVPTHNASEQFRVADYKPSSASVAAPVPSLTLSLPNESDVRHDRNQATSASGHLPPPTGGQQTFARPLAVGTQEKDGVVTNSPANTLRKLALSNSMNTIDGVGIMDGILSSDGGTNQASPGSPQRSLRNKKKLSIDCPAPVRHRSLSDCNDLAFEMAEAVLLSPAQNSPAPNSPAGGPAGRKSHFFSDPPSRRNSIGDNPPSRRSSDASNAFSAPGENNRSTAIDGDPWSADKDADTPNYFGSLSSNGPMPILFGRVSPVSMSEGAGTEPESGRDSGTRESSNL